ncbi:uncharacterized protein Boh2 [Calliphora vicina]|uniref:uncharacterized protein Boh2 n=1 Tax=Calliphora vicina TaxID=7373 RepID=UPI00325BF360
MMSAPEIASTTTPPLQTSDRRCENPDCNVNKLTAMVPKRKTTQFVADPTIMDKPMLVNGFTAVFQVDGSSGRLMDIKNPSGEGQPKTIYRIIPNSHVHVVNYVVVDTDETYLRKITENDPATMQKLLTSQKESADQMLKKIMSGQGSSATAAMTTVVSTINNSNTNITPQQATANAATSPAVPTVMGQTAAQKNSINLPLRMHPNLKITAVASGEGVSTAPTLSSNVTSTTQTANFITPVPLTNLQTAATVVGAPSTINPPTTDSVDKPTYDKMQEEINDLRRTVAMLAEAQAKNQQQPGSSKNAKRPRSTIPK